MFTPTIGIFHFPGNELANNKNKLQGRSGVYALYNPVNGNYYIGSAVNLWVRISDYGQTYYVKTYPHLPICKAIVKYGFLNMIVVVLEYTIRENTVSTEQKYIDLYNPPYNVLKIAHSTLGRTHREESKQKMRLAKLGQKLSPEHRAKISETIIGRDKGIPKSEQHKAKISATITGRKGNFAKFISVLDVNTGIHTTYEGIAKASKALGVSHITIAKYMGRQYKNYLIKSSPKNPDK